MNDTRVCSSFPAEVSLPRGQRDPANDNTTAIQELFSPLQRGTLLRGNHYCKSLCWASSRQHHSLRASPCSCEPPFPLSSPFSIPLKSTHICFPGNLTITKDMSQKGLKRDGLEKGQDQKAKQIWPLMRCAWPIAI